MSVNGDVVPWPMTRTVERDEKGQMTRVHDYPTTYEAIIEAQVKSRVDAAIVPLIRLLNDVMAIAQGFHERATVVEQREAATAQMLSAWVERQTAQLDSSTADIGEGLEILAVSALGARDDPNITQATEEAT